MKDNNKTKIVSSGGIGFLGALQIVFIILKLCKVINWSWWLVLIPIYISVGLFIAILIFAIVLVIIGAIIENR